MDTPPNIGSAKKPILLYDGDCGFCKYWIDRWESKTRDMVVYMPYQTALSQYPGISAEDCQKAVQLVMPSGEVFSGAHAVLKVLALTGGWYYRFALWKYEHIPFTGKIMEALYRWVSKNRTSLSKMTGQKMICKNPNECETAE